MNKVKNQLISVAVLIAITSPAKAINLCGDNGYVLGFFNGVANTQAYAVSSLKELMQIEGGSYNGSTIDPVLLYNDTEGIVLDTLEVFRQRDAEFQPGHDELLTALIYNDLRLIAKLVSVLPEAEKMVYEMRDEIASLYSSAIVDLSSYPLTQKNYEEHNNILDSIASQHKKLLLVGHSQGNLFLNHAFDYIVPVVRAEGVKAVHIAPASTTLRGEYVLSQNDKVINLLRSLSNLPVPAANMTIPDNENIWMDEGHGLKETYLDDTRPGRIAIMSTMGSALSQLTPLSSDAFTASFTASMPGEIDMLVREPGGSNVEMVKPVGESGFIDVARRPLAYHASCESEKIGEGVYEVGFYNRSLPTGTVVMLQITDSSGELTVNSFHSFGGVGDIYYQNLNHMANVRLTTNPDGKSPTIITE